MTIEEKLAELEARIVKLEEANNKPNSRDTVYGPNPFFPKEPNTKGLPDFKELVKDIIIK